jgi:glycosyltransferase involved in cell wall biosynthesis
MKKPLLSIVLVNRNHGELIEATLKSYINQSFSEFEIICIDGASDDDSIRLISQFPDVKLFSEPDKSSAEAFAKGMQLANSKYIMLGNSTDALIDENFISSSINYLERNQKISLVFGEVASFDLASNTFHKIDSYTQDSFGDYQKNFVTWLKTGETFHEHACIMRKDVLDFLFSDLTVYFKYIQGLDDDLFLTLRYLFHTNGFRSQFIDLLALGVANHENRISVDQRTFFLNHLDVYNRSLELFRQTLRRKARYRFISMNKDIPEKLGLFKFLEIKLFLEFRAFKKRLRKFVTQIFYINR